MSELPEETPRKILRDPTQLLDTRLETGAYQRDFPELPASRAEYLHDGEEVPSLGLRVGSNIDGYRIMRQIGRGGMGVVYEAEQVSLGRKVALKVLPPGAVRHKRAIDRFRREATAVARLSHPRIVAVHGFNIREGLAYLAMEFVDGLDLGEILDRLRTARTHGRRFVRISGPELDKDITEWAQGRKLMGTVPGDPRLRDGIVIDLRNPFAMFAALIADAADALRHAHAHGVIHRDIKPSNLILSREGRLKLSDFGLAKSIDADGSLTESGDFVGSPAYVSPEQADPRRVPLDERSDVYSLGVTLYELVTLHQPFGGKNVAVILRQILTRDPPPPTKLNPRVPRDLETIILKAIEKDPERRYASAEELGEDLRRFLNYEPIRARPLGAASRTLRKMSRHRMGLAVSMLGAAVLVLSALLALTDGGDGRDDERRQLEQAVLSRGLVGAEQPRALELVGQLLLPNGAAERRAALAHELAEAQSDLSADRLDELATRLAVFDAFAGMGPWDEVPRALLAAGAVEVKVDLIRRLHRELERGELSAVAQRQRLTLLEGLLDDADWFVVENAATAVGELAQASSLGALLDAFVKADEPLSRRALINGLRRYGHPDAVPLLTEALSDELPEVRLAALEALDALDPEDLLVRTAPLARDKAAWVRQHHDAMLTRRRRR